MSEVPAKDSETGRFVSGNIGGGRAKGSRNKLGEEFIQKLYADFQEHGEATIVQVRTEKPDAYLKVIAGILPKELKITTENDLSDDQLIERIRQLDAAIRPFLALEGEGDVASGNGSAKPH
jgi:hypothetical protein